MPFSAGGDLVSSNNWEPTKDLQGVYSMTPGSGLENANLVYIPYCSSDAHTCSGKEIMVDFLLGPELAYFYGQHLAFTTVETLLEGNIPSRL